MAECCEVVVTAPDGEWLAEFTRSLVDDRIVACGHVSETIRSVYRWQGQVYDEAEARVRLHTRAELVGTVVERARRDHPYEVPCVIAIPIVDGHPGYLAWIEAETTPA